MHTAALRPISRVASAPAFLWLRWPLLLCLIALCYWPGLTGGFVFDDDVNILQNESLRLSSLNLTDLWAAAWSGNAGPLGRPIALLTFAFNYYAGGPESYYFKLTNLAIHLCNTLLVGAVAHCLCGAMAKSRESAAVKGRWEAWIVAAMWGLHPLNLTGVLYVVQRMTSLSTLFGLAALLVYASYRNSTVEQNRLHRPLIATTLSTGGILLLLLLSALTKESGLLFGVLLVWIEFQVYGFRFAGSPVKVFGIGVRSAVALILALGLAYVAIFVLPHMLVPGKFVNRGFTLEERLMTEARVLFFYLRMFLLPTSSELSLYHDDFVVSASLLSPPTTALAVLGLAAITSVSWLLRKKFPALLFAWGWFVIAHLLESTAFPLEMVHEHRNYFATIGFIIALALAWQRIEKPRSRRLVAFLFCAYLAILGFVTHIRSLQWSNNVDWAAIEASNHPQSVRANYELSRIYMVLMNQTGDKSFGELADQALDKATHAYRPGLLPFVARIQLAYFRGAEPEPELLPQVLNELRHGPYHTTNTAMLNSFVTCQIEDICRLPDAQLLEILAAALENRSIPVSDRAEVLKLVAQYRINKYNDLKAGTEDLRKAISTLDLSASRIMLAQALGMQGQFEAALEQLDTATSLDNNGLYRHRIERERTAIRTAMGQQPK